MEKALIALSSDPVLCNIDYLLTNCLVQGLLEIEVFGSFNEQRK